MFPSGQTSEVYCETAGANPAAYVYQQLLGGGCKITIHGGGGEGGNRGALILMYGRSRLTIDSSPSYNAETEHARVFTDQANIACTKARIAVTCRASRMKGGLRPTKNPL